MMTRNQYLIETQEEDCLTLMEEGRILFEKTQHTTSALPTQRQYPLRINAFNIIEHLLHVRVTLGAGETLISKQTKSPALRGLVF